MDVFMTIFERAEDKNPKDNFGFTPLHLAAENGHLELCQLIIENVQDKNPKNSWDKITPLQNDHFWQLREMESIHANPWDFCLQPFQ